MAHLIFDLDGTLWDTTAPCTKAWNIALKRLGLSHHYITESQLKSLVGLPRTTILRKLFPWMQGSTFEKMYELSAQLSLQQVQKTGGTLYPYAIETLNKLSQKHQLYIVSNCQEYYLSLFIKQSGLKSIVNDTDCWGRNKRKKALNIRDLMNRNKIKEAYYIGDTQGDFDAAKEAGATFIYASYGFGQLGLPSQHQIHKLSDLSSLI